MIREPKIEIGLNAAMVTVEEGIPKILRVRSSSNPQLDTLPYGRFNPLHHRTMEEGLRSLSEDQTGLRPGYVEQLYTFGDRGRTPSEGEVTPHVVSVGYLALTRENAHSAVQKEGLNASWRNWYDYLPWEDWRAGRPSVVDDVIIPALQEWSSEIGEGQKIVRGLDAASRVRIAFGLDDGKWEDELVLDRYELIYSGGLISEAVADGRTKRTRVSVPVGTPMLHDHRRILATAIARLRGKLKYRPVIFELMPEEFTLYQLQQTVECIFGRSVHKQNFRRLVENADLVEPTGASQRSTGGRPAALFRFRSAILRERPAPGLKVG